MISTNASCRMDQNSVIERLDWPVIVSGGLRDGRGLAALLVQR